MANRNMKIESLQSLRAIAFLGIFTSHSCWNSQLGALGVSVFFVLSGFLMTINYWDAKLDTSFRECFQFSWQKISRLYPLHILMLVVAIPFEFNRSISNDSVGIVYSFVKILSSVSLTQSWFPDFGFMGHLTVWLGFYRLACFCIYVFQ